MDRFSTLYGENTPYVEDLFKQFQEDASSVAPEWRTYFESVNAGYDLVTQARGGTAPSVRAPDGQARVARLIQGFRTCGHRYAHINPLREKENLPESLSLESYGLSGAQLANSFETEGVLATEQGTLKEIFEALQQTYTSSIGVQYIDVPDKEALEWLRERMELSQNKSYYNKDQKKEMLRHLLQADKFEQFLHTKYVGVKRFSVEGVDAIVPMLNSLVNSCGELGVDDVVLGMSHRGRLNTLVNLMEKPLEEIFAAFNDTLVLETSGASSDVKYHMGRSCDVQTPSGKNVHISMLNNPSHLEAINPVVEGSARAKQIRKGEGGCEKVIPVLLHGDAAFCGQGIVPETLNLANLAGYTTGGTVHIITNNQVGFTANPHDGFSGEYCTDTARILQVPIFHVNGEDVEACVHVTQIAMEFRQKFKKDVVIDLVSYRKYGHNEGDDPTFTQPVMYRSIKGRKTPYGLYKAQLLAEGTLTEPEIQKMEEVYSHKLHSAFEAVSKGETKVKPDMFGGAWQGLVQKESKEPKTSITATTLKEVAACYTETPEGFEGHPKIMKGMEKRQEMLTKGGIDWGSAEVTAYGALLKEGYSVRISGQDVRRGTFSHRHIALVDYNTGEAYMPVSALAQKGANLEVWNSSLSELAVLGFEYGYTLAAPQTLTVWEAQFGDFANGAQIIMDQFISSSEAKWNRMSGLVMLLPHGFEGQGPEHSSGRMERYLQLCAENNMMVMNLSTPAQIFHALRRQMHMSVRRPLVIFTPKSLLRNPKATSTTADLTSGKFEKVIDDKQVKSASVKRLVVCTGKIYYDLLAEQEKEGRSDVALVRLEQIYPLAVDEMQKVLLKYKKAEVVWVQEEPRNQGAWTYIQDAWLTELGGESIRFMGRESAASPAVGSHKRHHEQQHSIIEQVFNLKK